MNDLIDRQAAMSGIMDFMPAELKADATVEERVNYSAWCCALSCAEAFVRTMPPAKPKTGRWIADGQKQKHGHEWMHCSVCGVSDIDVPATHTNYCPNCGAKMGGDA